MGFQAIRYEVADGVAQVTLDRPERLNAISPELRDDIFAALDLAKGDDAVRVLVITGAGRGFCSGADLSGRAPPGQKDESSQADKLDDMTWLGRFALALNGFD